MLIVFFLAPLRHRLNLKEKSLLESVVLSRKRPKEGLGINLLR